MFASGRSPRPSTVGLTVSSGSRAVTMLCRSECPLRHFDRRKPPVRSRPTFAFAFGRFAPNLVVQPMVTPSGITALHDHRSTARSSPGVLAPKCRPGRAARLARRRPTSRRRGRRRARPRIISPDGEPPAASARPTDERPIGASEPADQQGGPFRPTDNHSLSPGPSQAYTVSRRKRRLCNDQSSLD